MEGEKQKQKLSPWDIPAAMNHPAAASQFYTISAPLLAGFSIGLLGIVVASRSSFPFADVVIAMAMVAIGALVFSMQLGMWANQFAATPSTYLDWQPGVRTDAALLRDLQIEQWIDRQHWEFFRRRASDYYRVGIIFTLLAATVAAAPQPPPPQPEPGLDLRALLAWVPSLIGLGWVIAEMLWARAARLTAGESDALLRPTKDRIRAWHLLDPRQDDDLKEVALKEGRVPEFDLVGFAQPPSG